MAPNKVLSMSGRGFLVILLCAACDPRATQVGQQNVKKTVQLSREYEACTSSADCQLGFRCLENSCQRQGRDMVGDYYLTAAESAMVRKDTEQAILLYRQAVRQYQSQKLEPPPALFCRLGQAMARHRSDPPIAEEAAKILHRRCLRAVPVASPWYYQAMADLNLLGEVGFDPVHLAGSQVADRYLTKEAAVPDLDSVHVKVSGKVRTRAANYSKLLGFLGSDPGVRTALLPCWQAHYAKHRESQVEVTVRVRSRFVEAYDETDDGYRLSLINASAGQKGREEVYSCVKDALTPILRSVRDARGGSWAGNIVVKLGNK